jgi:hypothetical protein
MRTSQNTADTINTIESTSARIRFIWSGWTSALRLFSNRR